MSTANEKHDWFGQQIGCYLAGGLEEPEKKDFESHADECPGCARELKAIREIGREYPDSGYGGRFYGWLFSDDAKPYNSWGNGSAMRVSPVGFAFDTAADVLKEAARTAEV